LKTGKERGWKLLKKRFKKYGEKQIIKKKRGKKGIALARKKYAESRRKWGGDRKNSQGGSEKVHLLVARVFLSEKAKRTKRNVTRGFYRGGGGEAKGKGESATVWVFKKEIEPKKKRGGGGVVCVNKKHCSKGWYWGGGWWGCLCRRGASRGQAAAGHTKKKSHRTAATEQKKI